MITQGANPIYVRDQMGHKNIQTTLDTYGHLFPTRDTTAVDRLGLTLETGEDPKDRN